MLNNCPKCDSKLKYRVGKFGNFYGCSNYPQCKYTRSSSIEVGDNVSIKNIKTGEINHYKIVPTYIEYSRVFVGFGKYGSKYNDIAKKVYGGNPTDSLNPTISSDSGIGKLLVGNHLEAIIRYGDDVYEIIKHDIK